MTHKEILDFLSSFSVIATIEKIKAITWLDSYPQLEMGYANFTFQANGKMYIFRLQGNIPKERLYYSILKQDGKYLQRFFPLVDFNINLITCKELNNFEIYHYENKIYFK